MAVEPIQESSFAEELAAIAALGDMAASDPRIKTFADYIVNTTLVQAEILEEQLYAEMAAALSSEMSPVAREAALNMARNKAREEAQTLATNMTRTELKKTGAQIVAGFDAGEGPRQIARRLQAVVGLDGPRAKAYQDYVAYLESTGKSAEEIERMAEKEFQRLLRERRETIARTESRYATSEARLAEATARGARVKSWISTGDDRVSDECEMNEAQGPIPIEDDFAGGVDMPPQHPNCRCAVVFGTSDRQIGMMEERAEARSARTAAAKEDAKIKKGVEPALAGATEV